MRPLRSPRRDHGPPVLARTRSPEPQGAPAQGIGGADNARLSRLLVELSPAASGARTRHRTERCPGPPTRPLTIAVLGGYAHLGMVGGTGSGAVRPASGYAAVIPTAVPVPSERPGARSYSLPRRTRPADADLLA